MSPVWMPSSNVRSSAFWIFSAISALPNCTNIRHINLGENSLTGTIPTTFGLLQNVIGMRLEGNNLSGTIPSELGLLSRLHRLRLGDNDGLTGAVPSELGLLNDTLRLLTLNGTSLVGTIPQSLCSIHTLEFDCIRRGLCGCWCSCSET